MAKTHYMADDEAGRVLWLNNFSGKLSGYAATFNLAAAEVTDMTVSATIFSFVVNRKRLFTTYASNLVTYTKLLASGAATANVATFPVPPVVGTVPPLVLAGIFKRAASLAQRIKNHPNYTTAIGEDLGLEGSDIVIDPATIKPLLLLRLQAGHPEIVWQSHRMDGLEIWKDPGTGVVAMLDVDDAPNYLDLSPLPAPVALWKYKAIYRLGGQQVGQWSDVEQIAVHA